VSAAPCAKPKPKPKPQPKPEPKPTTPWDAIITLQVVKPLIHTSDIINATSAVGEVSAAHLLGPRRHKQLTRLRWVAMYLAVMHCGKQGMTEIGRKFGGKDHTTVMYGRDKVLEDLRDNGGELFGPLIAAIETRLGLR
jgi:chromosomal replication initiation ATPase DnaA